MFYLLRSSAIVCDHDRRIADDRRSMFPYDRRRSQTLLRSAIRDHMETSLYFVFSLLLVACFGVAHIYRLVTNILSSHCRLVYLYLEISPTRFVSSFLCVLYYLLLFSFHL